MTRIKYWIESHHYHPNAFPMLDNAPPMLDATEPTDDAIDGAAETAFLPIAEPMATAAPVGDASDATDAAPITVEIAVDALLEDAPLFLPPPDATDAVLFDATLNGDDGLLLSTAAA